MPDFRRLFSKLATSPRNGQNGPIPVHAWEGPLRPCRRRRQNPARVAFPVTRCDLVITWLRAGEVAGIDALCENLSPVDGSNWKLEPDRRAASSPLGEGVDSRRVDLTFSLIMPLFRHT